MIHFAIDRGGTFTDIYAEFEGESLTYKLLSEDPQSYEDASSEGIKYIIEKVSGNRIVSEKIPIHSISSIRMGTTVATNALLERKGSRTALLITKGFKDILKIGYQNREKLFSLNIQKPEVCFESVLEVDERVIIKNSSVEVLKEPDLKIVETQLAELKKNGIESIGIVLMHSYIFPNHELKLKAISEKIGFETVSISSEVMPVRKIVNRGDTTIVDAYLTPHILKYINGFKEKFENSLDGVELLLMQSNGGLIPSLDFRGSNSIFSGPAGGVVGYGSIFQDRPIIGFDMGGTSTDVSRYFREPEMSYEKKISGIRIVTPQVNIITVAAGGGSRLFYKNSMFYVGPESSGSHPGPVCYRKGGYLSITDANLVLGRILIEDFPHIFGKSGDLPLDKAQSIKAFEELRNKVNQDLSIKNEKELTIEELALGFIELANMNMSKPILEISVEKGYDIKEHILASFGGAGPQHACSIARNLGIQEVYIHRDSGILSAYGMSQADIIYEDVAYLSKELNANLEIEIQEKYNELENKILNSIKKEEKYDYEVNKYLEIKYEGTENTYYFPYKGIEDSLKSFKEQHRRNFGFIFDTKKIIIEKIKVKIIKQIRKSDRIKNIKKKTQITPRKIVSVYFKEGYRETPVYDLLELYPGFNLEGPALYLNRGTTIMIEPFCKSEVNEYGDVVIQIGRKLNSVDKEKSQEPLELALFHNLYTSIAVRMGKVLQKTSVSTNIKERLDFSCALFDLNGNLIANAPHVPVHLGSMSYCVKSIIKNFEKIKVDDVFLTNSPEEGGSHLPDLTVITPYFYKNEISFFLASRGHHADIGGITPGSMPPFSKYLREEGAVFKSFKVIEKSIFQEAKLKEILLEAGARKIEDNISDIHAQIAANRKGIELLDESISKYGVSKIIYYANKILNISESSVRSFFKSSGRDFYTYSDYLDDGIKISLEIKIDKKNGSAIFDFSKSDLSSYTNQNTPPSVTYSCIVYAIRCLVAEELPLNEGFLKPIRVLLGENTILSPFSDSAVVGGNVTTSQRIVDVIFKAFGKVSDSTGCMNNLIFGNHKFGYYETIGGGSGAGNDFSGADGVHTHMTNTRITDPEILEANYPVILHEFSIRNDSGGKGQFMGGNGLIRELEFLEPMDVSLLMERRVFSPEGIMGGGNGMKGRNIYITNEGKKLFLPGKTSFSVQKNDRIRIETPGGGGYGESE